MTPQHPTAKRFIRRTRHMHSGWLRWQSKHLSQGMLLIVIALVLGVLTGMSAAALKRLIWFFDRLILSDLHLDSPNYKLLIFPIAGILATALFQMYVVKGNVARGTRIIKQDLDKRRYRLSPFTVFNPVIGCSMTIGCGASGGSEGPTALSGAAIGSVVGRWFGLSDAWLRLLVGIGGGAGIAAIFKSPMGGVLFTLEVLQMEMTTLPVIALVLACLVASATAYLLSDFSFDIHFGEVAAMDVGTLGWVLLLGLFCGLYSIWYNYTKTRSTKLFTSIRNPRMAILVTGSLLSAGAFMFPTLYGEGFPVITSLVNGEAVSFSAGGLFASSHGFGWEIGCLVAVLLIKGVLVSAAFSGGGVAGDFVPTFFAGSLAGYLFALICNTWLGADLPTWYFALAGMGCVMAGTVHAPLMALFILCETTNTYAFLFPYLLAIGVCYFTVKVITPRSWYGETGHDDVLALINLRQTPSLKVRNYTGNPVKSKNAANKRRDRKQP